VTAVTGGRGENGQVERRRRRREHAQMSSPTNVPTNKVLAATAGSGAGTAIGTIVCWLLRQNHVDLPPPVETAIATLFTASLTFAAAWLTPPGDTESITPGPVGPVSGR
jgi:hypothetical protein